MPTITPDALDVIRRVTDHLRLPGAPSVRVVTRPEPGPVQFVLRAAA